MNDRFKLDWGTYLTTSEQVIYGLIDGRGSGFKVNLQFYINDLKLKIGISLRATVYVLPGIVRNCAEIKGSAMARKYNPIKLKTLSKTVRSFKCFYRIWLNTMRALLSPPNLDGISRFLLVGIHKFQPIRRAKTRQQLYFSSIYLFSFIYLSPSINLFIYLRPLIYLSIYLSLLIYLSTGRRYAERDQIQHREG